VEDRHREPAAEGIAETAGEQVRHGDVVPAGAGTAKFDRITDRALDVLDVCLNETRTDPDVLKLRNLQLQAAQTVISNRIKVDDTLLRARQVDILPKIMEMIELEQAAMEERKLQRVIEGSFP
jgi:hypothetical protein